MQKVESLIMKEISILATAGLANNLVARMILWFAEQICGLQNKSVVCLIKQHSLLLDGYPVYNTNVLGISISKRNVA